MKPGSPEYASAGTVHTPKRWRLTVDDWVALIAALCLAAGMLAASMGAMPVPKVPSCYDATPHRS